MKRDIKALLEAMDDINDELKNLQDSDDNISSSIETGVNDGEKDLITQLDKLYTPILIMQQMNNTEEIAMEAMALSGVLTEHNIIKFDDNTKMAQLLSVSSLLIARDKDSDKYKMYKKSAEMKNALKIDIQKEEHAAAKELAKNYLLNVSTGNPSAVAKQAANKLLPLTQV